MTHSRLPSNLRVVSIRSVLSGMASTMGRAVWQPFVLSLGAPMTALGLLESLGGMRSLLPAPAQYLSGWLSDRLGRKPFIAAGLLAGLLGSVFFVIGAVQHNWLWLIPGIALAGMIYIADPPQDSLVAESTHPRQRGTAFSILMLAWMAPGIVAPTVGGFLAERWGYALVYSLQALLYGLGLFVVVRFLRETLRTPQRGVKIRDVGQALAHLISPPRVMYGLFVAIAVDSIAWGLGWSLLYGMLTDTYHYSTVQIGVMSSAMSIAWVITQLPAGRLIDRFGPKRSLVLSELLGVFVVIGWILSPSFEAFLVLQLLFGVMAAMWAPALRSLMANSVHEQQRGESLGRLAAFQGLVGFPAPLIGGMLYDHWGFHAPLTASLVGVVAATLLLALLVREPPDDDEPSHPDQDPDADPITPANGSGE